MDLTSRQRQQLEKMAEVKAGHAWNVHGHHNLNACVELERRRLARCVGTDGATGWAFVITAAGREALRSGD